MEPMDTIEPIDEGPSGLDGYLDAVARADDFEAERRLGGHGDGGTVTELVRFAGRRGSRLGPFVRKRMPLAGGAGGAYEALFRLQRGGARFAHLARIIDCYKTGSELVVVSEYLPGETLDRHLARRLAAGASPRAVALEVFPRICDAVSELHAAATPPIVHRDLKPSNVIVAPGGVFLIDLGIARRVRDGADRDTVRLGTRAFAPPEQYGFGQTDVRSDTYALGMILAYLLGGGDAPSGRPDRAAAERVAGPALAPVLERAVALDPEARYQSAADLREAFLGAVGEAAPAGSDTDPRPARDARRAGRPRARRARGDVAAGVLDAVLALVAALFCWLAASSVADPASGTPAQPLWYRAGISVFLALPVCLGPLYLVADKRFLYRLAPALAGRTLRDDVLAWAGYLLAAFAVLCVAAIAGGVPT